MVVRAVLYLGNSKIADIKLKHFPAVGESVCHKGINYEIINIIHYPMEEQKFDMKIETVFAK